MEPEKRTYGPTPKFEPRLIIHGGAGNIQKKEFFPEDKYKEYRSALLGIVSFLMFNLAALRFASVRVGQGTMARRSHNAQPIREEKELTNYAS